MRYENITLQTRERTAVLTIDHPPVNAWNLATIEEFEDAINVIENDRSVRVVVLTGAGEKCFSAGFDVTDAANAEKISPKARKLWRRIDRFTIPVIAAINGYALGGGFELTLSCQFRIMVKSSDARVGLTELNLGIIPGWGGTQRLARLVGRAKALDMILFSRKLDAAEALEIGLLNQVSEPGRLMDDAMTMAKTLAERPPLAVSWVLQAMAVGAYENLDAGLEAETQGSNLVSRSEDREEGFAAFLEKRKPLFKGK